MMKPVCWIVGIMIPFLLAACEEKRPLAGGGEAGSLTFKVMNRTGTETVASPSVGQGVRLYVADRRPEMNDCSLYCPQEWRYDLTTGGGAVTYTLSDMLPQWYKMAFICAPQLDGVFPSIEDHDFTHLYIDYSPVLSLPVQQPAEDLAVYRQVMDRWLKAGETALTEDVVLSRLTGRLVIDMGILKDQFEHPVEKIEVRLSDILSRLYLRDEAQGLILADHPQNYVYGGEAVEWDSDAPYSICMNLLPQQLTGGSIHVYYADESLPPSVFPLVNEEGQSFVSVKRNTITTLYFNGMEDSEFEVRYAGFNENDAHIGVDDDRWDGWQPFDHPAATGEAEGAYIIDYTVGGGTSLSARAGGMPDRRIQSLIYLLYQKQQKEEYRLVKKRRIPDIPGSRWPLSRENGMTWAQREALKDTLVTGNAYRAVFVANTDNHFLADGVTAEQVLFQVDLPVGENDGSLYSDARLVLPSRAFTDENMFYLAVADIVQDASDPHRVPSNCGVTLQRMVTRTDVKCSSVPGDDALGTLIQSGVYAELLQAGGSVHDGYQAAVSKLLADEFTLGMEFPIQTEKFKKLVKEGLNAVLSTKEGTSPDAMTIGGRIQAGLLADLKSSSPATLPCFDWTSAQTATIGYAEGTRANELSFDRVAAYNAAYDSRPAVYPVTEGAFSICSLGSNSGETAQNRLVSVTLNHGVSLAGIPVQTNQGGNEWYEVQCQPFAELHYEGSGMSVPDGTGTLKVTIDWEAVLDLEHEVDSPLTDYEAFRTALDAKIAEVYPGTLNRFQLALPYPNLSVQDTYRWVHSWTTTKINQ